MRREIAENRIWFGSRGDGAPRIKRFLSDARGGLTPTTHWAASDVGANENAKQHLQALFGDRVVFDGPKPVALVRRMLDIVFDDNETGIVLDFYAGSATTGEAALRRDADLGGNIRFMLVQLPEPVNASSSTGRTALQEGVSTVAEIGKERIRRVIAKMEKEREGKLDLHDRDDPEDLGFRVYKLGRSQLKRWRPYEGESIEEVQTLFSQFESPLVEDWDLDALRVEVMLQEGFPLDSRVERLSALTSNAVDCVSTEWCEHRLLICLDETVGESTVRALPGAMGAQDILVCLDSALTDDAKLRLADRCNVHVI